MTTGVSGLPDAVIRNFEAEPSAMREARIVRVGEVR